MFQLRTQSFAFRAIPALFWAPYAQRSRALGLERLYLVMSFDCDTAEDIEAALRIHSWLRARDRVGVFAVPGAQLLEGAPTYKKMATEGAEFINHGGAPHTQWRDGRYWSITFYDQMAPSEVEADIRKGHDIFSQVFGHEPKGFRAPHFGHYQKPDQLANLYRILGELGYRFATTTVPEFTLRYGPAGRANGMYEIPISGTYRNPLRIHDSWKSIKSPYEPYVTETYSQSFLRSIKNLLKKEIPGLVNHYVDPYHVAKSHHFFDALGSCIETGIPFLTYSHFVDMIERK